jgi:choline dehydrogenase-like flavoprotein
VTDTTYDVVIVGAGITGSVLALEAANAGLSVLILEAGTTEPATFSGYRRNLAAYYGAIDKTPEAPWPFNPNAPEPDIPGLGNDGAKYFVVDSTTAFESTYARILGGTTMHWLGTCLRMLPEDFASATRFGVGRDWPIGYDDLIADYERAEWEIGVSADVADQAYLGITFRDGYDYPMRRLPPSYSDERLGAAIDGMAVSIAGEDHRLHVRSTPAGRNSTPRGDYAPVGAVDNALGATVEGQTLARDIGQRCQGNSACVPICPVQAKYNALKTLAKAVATQRVTVLPQAVGSRILVDGGRVTGIEYLRYASPQSPAHETAVARGCSYVLACHAVENAKLMLMSGLQPEHGLVGAYLQDHPMVLAWGLTRDPVGSYRGPLSTSGIEDLRSGAFRSDHAPFRIEIGNDGWIWPTGAPDTTAVNAITEGLHGAELRALLNEQLNRQVRIGALVEQPPSPDNRVTIGNQVDALGLPRPVINYSLDPYVLDGMGAAAFVEREIFARADIEDHTDQKESFTTPALWRDQLLPWSGAGHFAGTHCMGDDARDSVVDADQRSWEHDNLFVAGPGSMPTMGTANPTLTVAALAYRTARALISDPERRP